MESSINKMNKNNINKKGKLKIFFGYSAGVGKTYAMLQSAHELKEQGVDVVIGYYEPHPRPETQKLINGLEKIPTKKIKYKNMTLEEFDVDKALERKPSVILVDELAHTNPEGCRNQKRYLDILELIDAGINVYTTVNVQHLESVNDLIKEKTDSNVRETVPDSIFDKCDEVELIDIDPKELISRLKAGKIYPKKQIDLALNNFFTIKKLNSLREMSMRQSADKINMDEHSGDIHSEIMVLITPSPSSEKNIRAAARLAETKHSTFSALYVEQNRENIDSQALEKHINLVENLGGSTTILYGEDIPSIIANFVKIHQIKTIVIGKSWSRSLKKGIENQLIALLPDIEFSIIPFTKGNRRRTLLKKVNLNLLSFDWISTVKTILSVALLGPIYYLLKSDDFNVICVFLFFVAMLIVSYKNKNAIYVFVASLAGSLEYILIGQVFHEHLIIQVITFIIMFSMGLLYGWFVYKYGSQLKKISRGNKSIDAISVLVSNIYKCSNDNEKYKCVAETLSALLSRSCYIYMGMNKKNNFLITNKDDTDTFEGENEKIIMEWTKNNNKPSGKGTQTLTSSNARYEPIQNKNGDVWVIGISCKNGKLNYQELLLLKTLLPIVQISFN